MTHSELCLETAKHFTKETCKLSLYEYKSFVSQEEPDVLCFYLDHSSLYEIKMSRADFLADQKKECRKKYIVNNGYTAEINNNDAAIRRAYVRFYQYFPELIYIEKTHLGNYRYYVCPKDMVKPEEIPEGWGLYWYDEKKKRFTLKKESGKFRTNMKTERELVIHAMRRYASNDNTGILINTY
jgi:hypothetical protein